MPLCCNVQTPCFCWISCLSFPLWVTALWLFPSLSVSKGQVSRSMPLWAKNAENEEELLRLDQRVQGAGTGIVDNILLRVQWMIIPNVTQTERATTVQSISTRSNTLQFLFIKLYDVVMHFWRRDCLFLFHSCLTSSSSLCPLDNLLEMLIDGPRANILAEDPAIQDHCGCCSTPFKSLSSSLTAVRTACSY